MKSFKWKGEEIPRPVLKPCAHCGHQGEYFATYPVIGDSESSEWAKIRCENRDCAMSTPVFTLNWKSDTPYHDAFEKVASIWNRRVV